MRFNLMICSKLSISLRFSHKMINGLRLICCSIYFHVYLNLMKTVRKRKGTSVNDWARQNDDDLTVDGEKVEENCRTRNKLVAW